MGKPLCFLLINDNSFVYAILAHLKNTTIATQQQQRAKFWVLKMHLAHNGDDDLPAAEFYNNIQPNIPNDPQHSLEDVPCWYIYQHEVKDQSNN